MMNKEVNTTLNINNSLSTVLDSVSMVIQPYSDDS